MSARIEFRRMRKEARYWPFVYRVRKRMERRERAKHDQRPPWKVLVRFHVKKFLLDTWRGEKNAFAFARDHLFFMLLLNVGIGVLLYFEWPR